MHELKYVEQELEKQLSEKLTFRSEVVGDTNLVHFISSDEKKKDKVIGTAKLTREAVWKYTTTGGICGDFKSNLKVSPKEEKKEVKEEKKEAVKTEKKVVETAAPKEKLHVEGSIENNSALGDEDNNVFVTLADGTPSSFPTTKPISQMNGGMISMLAARIKKANQGCTILNSNIPDKYKS